MADEDMAKRPDSAAWRAFAEAYVHTVPRRTVSRTPDEIELLAEECALYADAMVDEWKERFDDDG